MSALTAPNAFRRREGNFHKLEAAHDHRNGSASFPNGMMVAKHEAGSLTAAATGKCAPAQVC